MTAEDRSQYASYTAPPHHGEKLLEPDFASVQRLLLDSPERFNQFSSSVVIRDTSLGKLSQSARCNLLQSAKRYTASYRDLPKLAIDSESKIVMSGHQPELFHCGVWYKNFVLSDLGKSSNATPIHFIVDNDLCRASGIQVPCVVPGETTSRWVAFDSPAEPMPWENRKLQDAAAWRSFPTRVHQACAKLIGDPLLNRLWQHASRLDSSAPLGCLLSQARHLVERDLALQTLEIPLSELLSTSEFAQFSLHVLTHLGRFHEIFNDELDNYRQAHRIRNHAQPLPSLGFEGEWLEAPFWCYSAQSITREPLWISHQSGRMLLSDRKGWEYSIVDSVKGSAVEQWAQLHAEGMRIRPRALITTMYARLVLCDLFVHGIGGGKYDQITDRIVARFFSFAAPPYVVASATMQLQFDELPADLQTTNSSRFKTTQQGLNAVAANPEILLQMVIPSLDAEQREKLAAASEQKQQLLRAIPSKGEKWEWHLAMKQAKRKLAELAQPHFKQLQAEFDKLQALAKQQAMLSSREYSFCLFPLEEIRKTFS